MSNLIANNKCIVERTLDDIARIQERLICEKKEVKLPNGKVEHDYFIEGVMGGSDPNIINGNGRKYDYDDMCRAVETYNRDFIDKKIAFGELRHPNNAEIDYDRTSHIITEMYMDGYDIVGKAKIFKTTLTEVVREMIDHGSPIGMSTRVVGDIFEMTDHMMVSNFDLVSVDLVTNASYPKAWLNGVLKEKQYVVKEGVILECKDIQPMNKSFKKYEKPKKTYHYVEKLDKIFNK